MFGGSRGARSINQALAAALTALLPRCQVVHISGTLDWPEVEARRKAYRRAAYALSRLPILARRDAGSAGRGGIGGCPCGASTLGEFPALAFQASWCRIPTPGNTRTTTRPIWPIEVRPSSCRMLR